MSGYNMNISKLCEACIVCLGHLWRDNHNIVIQYYRHHSLRDVKMYASFGCEYCKYIALVLRLYHRDFDKYDDVPLQMCLPRAQAWKGHRFIHLNWRPNRVWEAVKIPGVSEGQKLELTQVFHPFGEKELPQTFLAGLSATKFGRRTDSTFCRDLMARWLKNCLKTHTICGMSINSRQQQPLPRRWTPTRLIQIEHLDSGQIFRLIHPTKDRVGPLEAYLTLSHCWGNKQPSKLLRENLKSYEDGCNVSCLPKTFRDAIQVCGWLNVRHIWIDSLCIVQNSEGKADWKREANQMHQIYTHGLLNLAASTAPDGDAGLFRDRDPNFSCKPISKLNLPYGSVVLIPEPDILAAIITNGPLVKRGWVLQEQLLSRRIIHFGEQLFWECAEMWTCETFGDVPVDILGLLGCPWYFSIRQQIQKTIKLEMQWVPSARRDFLYEAWDTICMEYSRRQLTEEGDRLIGLKGIIRHFESLIYPDDYAAGLWKRDLIPGLWYSESLKSRCNTTIGYRVPSWTWLSQTGEISYASKERRYGYYLARLENLCTDASTNDGTPPQQEDSYITLFGLLRPAHLRHTNLFPAADVSYDVLFDGHIAMTSGKLQKGTNHAKIVLDTVEQIKLGNLYLLPLVISTDEDRRWAIMHGLILRRMSLDRGDTYCRAGYFETTILARLFYGTEVYSPSASPAGNPWDVLDSYGQLDDEPSSGKTFLDCLDKSHQDGRYLSPTQLQTRFGSYKKCTLQPLQEQMITIS